MFVGHAFAAFALIGAVAVAVGVDRDRALLLAVAAALFATLPDVDILYGPFGLLNGVSGVFDAADAFWTTGNVAHRGPTHSMVVGAVTASAVALWHRRTTVRQVLAAGLLIGVVAVGATSGSVAGAVTLVFVLGAVALTRLTRLFDLSTRQVLAVALVGLLSHPLGDLLTGEPPAMLFPFDVALVAERFTLAGDPTLHLLGAFAIELAVVWLGVAVYANLTGRGLRRHIGRKATVGVAYAGAAVALPAPTLETSYQFVFTVLAVGGIGITQRKLLRRELRSVDWLGAVATGLAAITLAALAYLVVYLAM